MKFFWWPLSCCRSVESVCDHLKFLRRPHTYLPLAPYDTLYRARLHAMCPVGNDDSVCGSRNLWWSAERFLGVLPPVLRIVAIWICSKSEQDLVAYLAYINASVLDSETP